MALTLPTAMRVTPEQFWEICQANPEAVLELNAQGILEEMTPTGWQSNRRNASLTEQLRLWWRQTREGAVFDSSAGFCLPNGAVRSPDAAWVSAARLQAVAIRPLPWGWRRNQLLPPACRDWGRTTKRYF